MSNLPERTKGTLPQVIRNLKPRRWPTIVMRLCLLCAGLSCLMAIIGSSFGVPRDLVFLLAAPACLGVVVAVGFAVALLLTHPVEKIVLVDWLEVWPGKSRYQVGDVQHVEFVSGPEEDYAETNAPRPVREVRIALRTRHSFRELRATIDGADAMRLIEWARQHDIRVIGADRL